MREAYHALGVENIDDPAFDADFARRIRGEVRWAAAERLECESLDKPLSLREVRLVVKEMSKGAGGPDEILSERIRASGDRMTLTLWLLTNAVWAGEQCPEEWGQGLLVLLYKDGDKRDPYNYRGITLLSVVSKAFAALVNSRLIDFGDTGARLAEEQAGFRTGSMSSCCGRCCACVSNARLMHAS